jgi:xanthine/CO dehydrogenase XdhC/CoxF family maturation factor
MSKITEWQGHGLSVALATVVKTWGSAPRPIGSKMAIAQTGDMVGSVSGGCVEAAVLEEGLQVLASGEPKLVRFGVADGEAWAVGLSCGGQIEVFVEPLES